MPIAVKTLSSMCPLVRPLFDLVADAMQRDAQTRAAP